MRNDEKFAFLYGDSHADALMHQAKKKFESSSLGLMFSSKSACPPIMGVYRRDHGQIESCFEHNNKIYEFIKSRPEIKYVILTARWTLGLEGERFNNQEGGIERGRKPHLDLVQNGNFIFHEKYNHKELLAEAYIKSVISLLDAGKKVILIYPVPEAGWDVPDYIFKSYIKDRASIQDEFIASTSYSAYQDRNSRTIMAFDSIGIDENLIRIIPEKEFCNSFITGRCITHKDEVIFYRDDDHLSDAGAALILQKVMNHID